ncbi:MAG: hypothetical protein L0207_05375 [Chlamydiae bacterium]|nr:hypothetical protein [Chlamydiota bacterium]
MAKPLTTKKRAKRISLAIFLIGIAILTYSGKWWPGLMLAIGIPIAARQYLLGRHYDVGITLFVFLGVFITVQFNISWKILLPVLFTIGGIYIFFREYIESRVESEEEEK